MLKTKKMEIINKEKLYVFICLFSVAICLLMFGVTTKAETITEDKVKNAAEMTLNQESTVNIGTAKEVKWLKFTAPKNGMYYFTAEDGDYKYSEGKWYVKKTRNGVAEIHLEKSDYGHISQGINYAYELKMNETCYIKAYCKGKKTGTYKMAVAEAEELSDGKNAVTIAKPGQTKWYRFSASESAYYSFLAEGGSCDISHSCLYTYDFDYDDSDNKYFYLERENSGSGSADRGFRYNKWIDKENTYYISVNCRQGKTGSYNVYANQLGKQVLSESDLTSINSNTKSLSVNQDETLVNATMNSSIWYKFTAPSDGYYKFKVNGKGTLYSYGALYTLGWDDYSNTTNNVYGTEKYNIAKTDNYILRSSLKKGEVCYVHFIGEPGSSESLTITPYMIHPGYWISESAVSNPTNLTINKATDMALASKGNYQWLKFVVPETGCYYLDASTDSKNLAEGVVYRKTDDPNGNKDYEEYCTFATSDNFKYNMDSLWWKKGETIYIYITSTSDKKVEIKPIVYFLGYETITSSNVSGVKTLLLDEKINVEKKQGTEIQWYEFVAPTDGYYSINGWNEPEDFYFGFYVPYYVDYDSKDDSNTIIHNDGTWYLDGDDIDDAGIWSYIRSGCNLNAGEKIYFSVMTLNPDDSNFKLSVQYNSKSSLMTNEIPKSVLSMEENKDYSVKIDNIEKQKWFAFTPSQTQKYTFYTTEDEGESYLSFYEVNKYNSNYSYRKSYVKDGNFYTGRLTAGTMYYINATAGGKASADYKIGVTSPQNAVSLASIKQTTKYSSMLAFGYHAWGDEDPVSYGTGEAVINYNGFSEKVNFSKGESQIKDRFGNYILIELADSSKELAWKHKNMGTYPFNASLYDRTGNKIGNTLSFNREIVGFEDFGVQAVNLELEKLTKISRNSKMNIYKFTAKNTGKHVIHYTKKLGNFHVYNAQQNRANWTYGNSHTFYGKMIAGQTYYIVMSSEGGAGNLVLGFYNGATDPNASVNPATSANANPGEGTTETTETPGEGTTGTTETEGQTAAGTTQSPAQNITAPAPVNAIPSVPVQKIAVAKSNIYLRKGKTFTLSMIVTPSNTTDYLTFVSSDSQVAAVDLSGKIKALKPGTAMITVRAASGQSCIVKVVVAKKKVEGKSIRLKKKMILKMGTVQFLSYKVLPKTFNDKILFNSSRKSILAIDHNGKMTAKKKGKAIVTIKIGKLKAACSVTVK